MKGWRSCVLWVVVLASNLPPWGEEAAAEPLGFSYSASGLMAMPVEAPVVVTNAPMGAPAGEELELSLHSISEDYSFEASVQQYEGINGSPALVVPPPKEELGGAAGWAQAKFEQAVSMEVVRVRKVALSGSIITAVKRKNPLYLLNPLVFVASW